MLEDIPLRLIRSSEGFTLIELLITVAIIGILATVGITQYGAYHQRGFNVAAVGDLKNFKAALEAYFAENNHYP